MTAAQWDLFAEQRAALNKSRMAFTATIKTAEELVQASNALAAWRREKGIPVGRDHALTPEDLGRIITWYTLYTVETEGD